MQQADDVDVLANEFPVLLRISADKNVPFHLSGVLVLKVQSHTQHSSVCELAGEHLERCSALPVPLVCEVCPVTHRALNS